jgi:phosphatidylglycerol:prolipoprotein diacylglycerol transferase
VVLVRIGNLFFVNFGVFAGLGALLTLLMTGLILVGQGLPAESYVRLALGGSAAVVLGAWLFGQLLDYRLLLRSPLQALRRPVFVSWGGALCVIVLFGVFGWYNQPNVLPMLDALARSILLGHAIGRIGCLTFGCCFGHPTGLRLRIVYRNPLSKAVRIGGLGGVPVHPAPLYEAVMDVVILLLVNFIVALGAPRGVPTCTVLGLYGLGRFAIEFARNNEGRMLHRHISLNHLISLSLAVLGSAAALLFHTLALPMPAMSWGAGLEAIPGMLPGLLLCAGMIFLGFSLHRGRVGEW